MKNTFTFLLLLFLVITFNAQAQNQIVNLGFENYDNLGQEAEEPVGWNSFMTAQDGGVGNLVFGFAQSQKVERSTVTRPGSSGTYSARIWSNDVFGNVANGNLTTGRINVGSTTPTNQNNHNKTITGNASFNQTFTGKPDSIVVWVKYSAANGQEARVSATIHDAYDYRDPSGTDANAPSHVVAKAVQNFSPSSSWQRISIPFDYNHPATNAQYALISFTTNKTPGGGATGDEVYIDDMQFIYVPKVTVTPNTAQILVENQNGTTLTANENFTADSREWKYSAGAGYQSFSSPETGSTYTPQFASAGSYFVRCESTIGGQVIISNVVSITVNAFTNSIAPVSSQVIFQNQNGNALTVTESPNANSREWKYTTTSGSGYTSFTSAETGTSYTPLFFAINTYYVVCESTLGGVTTTSNEVEIQVTQSSTPSISITPQAAQNIEVNINGTTLTANETITPSAREWKYSTTSGSGYQSFPSAVTANAYTPNFAVAANYYVICESTMSGTVYTSNEVEINVVDLTVVVDPATTQNLVENIAGDTLFATESQTADSREWKYNTQLGAPFQTFSTTETETFFVPKFADNGYYYVICESNFNGILKQSNFVTIIVDNGPEPKITPSNTQNIDEDENGSDLSINAGTFTVDMQEWKYSDSSGGTFNSFTNPELNATYTPLFSNSGEYYIISDVSILGENFRTNEVKIIVAELVSGIIDYKEANFKVYLNNKQLLVDLTATELMDAHISIFNLNGQVIANEKLNALELNSIPLNTSAGIYLFNIKSNDTIYQGKIQVK